MSDLTADTFLTLYAMGCIAVGVLWIACALCWVVRLKD